MGWRSSAIPFKDAFYRMPKKNPSGARNKKDRRLAVIKYNNYF
jgi:hypothetical protein